MQSEAGHTSNSRSRRPPGERPELARGGSRAAFPARAQAASGRAPASRGPGPQIQARKASFHLPAPRSGSRRRRLRAAHPNCQVSHPSRRPRTRTPGARPQTCRGDCDPATQVGIAHAAPGFEHLCPRKLISSKARPELRLSLNPNTRVTWPELRAPSSEPRLQWLE